jgi:hypothetical protein
MQGRSDINFSAILKWGGGLLGLAIIVHMLMLFLFNFLNARQAGMDPKPSPMFQKNQRPPDPQLQVSPALDLQKYRAAEQDLLTSYDWVDREKGIVRIPVDDAMKLFVRNEKSKSSVPPAQEPPGTPDLGSGTK